MAGLSRLHIENISETTPRYLCGRSDCINLTSFLLPPSFLTSSLPPESLHPPSLLPYTLPPSFLTPFLPPSLHPSSLLPYTLPPSFLTPFLPLFLALSLPTSSLPSFIPPPVFPPLPQTMRTASRQLIGCVSTLNTRRGRSIPNTHVISIPPLWLPSGPSLH